MREGNEIMILSIEGIMIRLKVAEISQQGRNTMGVVLMRWMRTTGWWPWPISWAKKKMWTSRLELPRR